MTIKFSADEKRNAILLYEEGNSIKEVSKLTGISSNKFITHQVFIYELF
jgi:transposase-like protein